MAEPHGKMQVEKLSNSSILYNKSFNADAVQARP